MIKIENVEVVGWEHAIRGMRNPMNSWAKSDSKECIASQRCADCEGFSVCNSNQESYFKRFWMEGCPGQDYAVGPNDHELMMNLANGGPVHAKYRRMITVYLDITAPLYWWKEFDTYKVGTVANSCSTMHKIDAKPFSINDISCDELMKGNLVDSAGNILAPELKAHYKHMTNIISSLNNLRDLYLKTNDKRYWRCIIEMLPSSYNQKRTVMLNYEVLVGIYKWRKEHKLDEWREFCKWIESLPYSEIITGETED